MWRFIRDKIIFRFSFFRCFSIIPAVRCRSFSCLVMNMILNDCFSCYKVWKMHQRTGRVLFFPAPFFFFVQKLLVELTALRRIRAAHWAFSGCR